MSAPRHAIFISYRRRDSIYAVDRLDERLKHAFGADAVFRDIRSIRKGHDFPADIRNALNVARLGLVVIGPRWLKTTASARRLDDPKDWVRIEIETLFRREGVPVIPLLLGGADMPKAEDLPDTLRQLLDRNGMKLQSEREFEDSVGTVIEEVGRLLEVTPQALAPQPQAAPPRSAAAWTRRRGERLLEDIGAAIAQPGDVRSTLDRIVQLITDRFNVEVCSIYSYAPAIRRLILVATDGFDPGSVGSVSIQVGEGLTGLVIEKAQPVMAIDAMAHPRYKYFPETGMERYHSFLGVPILDKHEPLGVLVVQTLRRRSRFVPKEVRSLQAAAVPVGGLLRQLGSEGNALLERGQANLFEREARDRLRDHDLQGALEHLLRSVRADPARKDRISEEFAFAFNFDTDLKLELRPIRDASDAFDWRSRIWQVLAARNSFPLETLGELELKEAENEQERANLISAAETTAADEEEPPEKKGDKLERAVARLFGAFFDFGEDIPWKIRRQKRGTQGGYDLSIEWTEKCEVTTAQRVRCHVECKNYKNGITPKEVAEKLLSEPQQPPLIEHWILISPRANPSNELNRLLEQWQKDGRFPFEVQIWCPETGVAEFFGLEPDVYDQFSSPFSLEPHPRTWDEIRRAEVREKWKTLLKAPLRLPKGWPEYVRDPSKLCSPPEDANELSTTFDNYVPMRCRNTAGALLEKPLSAYIEEWLTQREKPVLFLLGEFGDGKTCFTYVLARHLLNGWERNRETGWLPLRLTLKKFPGNGREFLRRRLEEFNAEVGGWLELGKSFNQLVILDGFDEMSVRLDPAAVTKNIGDLLACAKEFEGCKLLITSRTHFFENRQDAQRLMARLGDPPVYHLAPIERQEVTRHLVGTVSGEEARRLLDRVKQMSDPIGLAGKPLFLEMLKEVLSSPSLPRDLNVLVLYERYIEQALTRKSELLDDPDLLAHPQATVQNLQRILGEIAEELQRTGQGYVSLNKYQAKNARPFAQLLWKLSGSSEADRDARSRVGARSLLGRVVHQDIQDEWPVDFCHRSMREYFVALRLCEAVEASEKDGARFLKEVVLNHEILEFAAERWRKAVPPSVKERLLGLIRRAEHQNNPGRMGGYALTLLYRLDRTLPRDFCWSGRVFDDADLEEADLSGMDFHNCSFRSANLANVNLENSNFEDCDLTGVRIEETKPVVSLAAAASRDKLFAFYGDGVLREWNLELPGKATWKVVGLLPPEPGSVLGLHESGQMWLHTPRSWMFLAPQEVKWQPQGSFAVKDGYGCVWAAGDCIALVEKSESDAARVLLVDLERQGTLNARRVRLVRWCAALGNDGLVWSDAGAGFRVASMRGEPPERGITLSSPEPTCLGVQRCRFGEYLVAGGVGDGRICVWRLDPQGTTWAQQKVLDVKVHDGPVTSVAFTSDTCVASGGADRAIVLTRFGEDATLAGHTECRLQLTLRCKGMKIRGLKGPAEYEVLARCIAESSS